jgi:hypothetical protein
VHEPLVVSARELGDEWVEAWLDTGAGPGFVTRVLANRLALAAIDDGNGEDAIYLPRLQGEDVPAEPAGQERSTL